MNIHHLLLLLLLLTPFTQSLRFDLLSGHTKCIAEEIKINAMTVGKYTVVNPNEGHPLPDSHKINVRVTSTHGSNFHNGEHVESGQFAFAASEGGDYLVCFYGTDHRPPVVVTVDFEWKTGVAAKDWTSVAKKGKLDAMQLELRKLEDTVQSIHDEMFYLREREEEMQMLNISTNSRMAWLSFLSLCVCFSVAGLQLWHLKTFFERKKIL